MHFSDGLSLQPDCLTHSGYLLAAVGTEACDPCPVPNNHKRGGFLNTNDPLSSACKLCLEISLYLKDKILCKIILTNTKSHACSIINKVAGDLGAARNDRKVLLIKMERY